MARTCRMRLFPLVIDNFIGLRIAFQISKPAEMYLAFKCPSESLLLKNVFQVTKIEVLCLC